MNRIMIIAVLIWLQIIMGCSPNKKYVQTELYFGLSQPGGEIIHDTAWNRFVQNAVVRIFPAGFSELHLQGKWYDADRQQLISEPTRMITVVYKRTQMLSLQIDSLRNRYKDLFRQQSVLRVDKKAGINF